MSQEPIKAVSFPTEDKTSLLFIEQKNITVFVEVEETVSIQSHEPVPQQDTSPQYTFLSNMKDQPHTPEESSASLCDAAASETTTALQSVLSSSTIASSHTRSSSTTSTTTSISSAGDMVALGLEVAAGDKRKMVEEDVLVSLEKMTVANTEADPKMEDSNTQGAVKSISVTEESVARPVRPTLGNAMSSSFFDVREGDSTPRRWRRKMDRNAMANPGASMYVPNNY